MWRCLQCIPGERLTVFTSDSGRKAHGQSNAMHAQDDSHLFCATWRPTGTNGDTGTICTTSWHVYAYTRASMFVNIDGSWRENLGCWSRQQCVHCCNHHWQTTISTKKQRRDRLMQINWHDSTACIIRVLGSMQYEAQHWQLSQCAMSMVVTCMCCKLSSIGHCNMMPHRAFASAPKKQLRRAKGSLHPIPRAKGSLTRHRRLILDARPLLACLSL